MATGLKTASVVVCDSCKLDEKSGKISAGYLSTKTVISAPLSPASTSTTASPKPTTKSKLTKTTKSKTTVCSGCNKVIVPEDSWVSSSTIPSVVKHLEAVERAAEKSKNSSSNSSTTTTTTTTNKSSSSSSLPISSTPSIESVFLSVENPYMTFGPSNAPTKILLSLSVHGNEPCGILACNELILDGWFDSLSSIQVIAVIGNPLALSMGVRFVEENLNRVIKPELFGKENYERQRAQELASSIASADYTLDVHSCSAPAPPHALPAETPISLEFAAKLPVGFVVRDIVHSTVGGASSMDYVRAQGKHGIAVESGQHLAPTTIRNARQVIKSFCCLVRNKIREQRAEAKAEPYKEGGESNWTLPPPLPSHPHPIVLRCLGTQLVEKGFEYVLPSVKAFQRVEKGTVIAKDSISGPILGLYSPSSYLVMPTANPVLGEEAWFWGVDEAVTPISAPPTIPTMKMDWRDASGDFFEIPDGFFEQGGFAAVEAESFASAE